MLEKAILLKQTDTRISKEFSNIESFLKLNDDNLLNLLSSLGEKSEELVTNIKIGKVYRTVFNTELDQERFQMSTDFLEALKNPSKVDVISDDISKKFNEIQNKAEYEYICDIVTSKAPSDIQIDKQDEETGEYVELRKKSRIVGAIQSQSRIKIYSDSKIRDCPSSEKINTTLKEIIEGLRIV
jgi:hypothetical protein